LVASAGEVRGGRAEEASKGPVEAADEAVEQGLVGAVDGGEGGFGVAIESQCAVPFSDHEGMVATTTFVTRDLIRGPPGLRRRCTKDGSRIRSGMTAKGKGARRA
jgi:hypothetical protein